MSIQASSSRSAASVPAPQGVGYVPFENFVGRAEIIFFSVKEGGEGWKVWEWPWTVRFGWPGGK